MLNLKKMKKTIACFAFILCLSIASFSQEVVDWSASAEKKGDHEYEVVFTAKIDKGWHLYSQHIKGEDGPVPTKFTFTPSKNYEVSGDVKEPQAVVKMDKTFEMEVAYFNDEVKFTQLVKTKCDKPENIKAAVEFMVCNDEMCLPPKTVDFDIPLK